MMVSQQKLNDAVQENIITPEQAKLLAEFLQVQAQHVPRLSFIHVLYYLGGCIAIAAMTLFMGLGWESFGGAAIVLMAALYAVVGLRVAQFLAVKELHIPAGICAAFVVSLTPLAMFGGMQWFGVWPAQIENVNGSWHILALAAGTLTSGAVVIRKYSYSFVVLPIVVALWFLIINATELALGADNARQLRELIALYSGLLIIAIAVLVDVRAGGKTDYAFWVYMVGALVFWYGLTWQVFDKDLSKLLYFGLNLLLIGVGVVLVRRVFVVLGAIGSFGYLNYLAFDVFRDSWVFPVALTVTGLSVVYLGFLWQKHEKAITAKARLILPTSIQGLLKSKL